MGQERHFTFQIEHDTEGQRLDALLSVYMDETSRSYIQKLIASGLVQVNGRTESSKKYKVQSGDKLELVLPEAEALTVEPQDIPLHIVYEDDDVLVVDKEKGMVVHPAPGNADGTLVNAILFHCHSLSSINGVVRPGIVHRIDKDTSGLLMVAKNDTAHKALAEQLQEHSITRAYQAVVFHNLKEDTGTVDAPVGRDPKNRLRMAVTERGGRRAVTHYKVLERFGAFTHVEARLETGRTHQIRVHMAYLKHPLLGDAVYGPKKQPFAVSGQVLHAYLLGFRHPRTGEYMEFESPLPQDFTDILEKLRA